MSVTTPSTAARRAVIAYVVVALLGLAGLTVAGAADQRHTAFSLEIDNTGPVVTLRAGEQACQGPVPVPAAFAGLDVWLDRVRAPGASLLVTVLSPAGATLASGSLQVVSGEPTHRATRLNRTVPAGSTVSLCFRSRGPVPASLVGAPAEPGSGSLEQNGRGLGTAAAVVLLSPRPKSLLRLLPTVFTRAALFRPAWMGAWTYWLILGALLVAFPLGALAVWFAAGEDTVP